MRTHTPTFWILLGAAALAACGSDPKPEGDGAYDETLLAKYRSILPSAGELSASEPGGGGDRAIGSTAEYPQHARPIVLGVNGAAVAIVAIMQAVVQHEPTLYNSETKEFFWGPWDNGDDFGTVAAYIREEPEGADFKYGYALLRGTSNDISTLEPVIWGGRNPHPDNEDWGSGVTLWDFEANHAFAEAHDPDYAQKDFSRGRFVALYGRGPGEDKDEDGEADGLFTFNVAVFNDFVPEDKPNDAPADAQYFYGKWEAEHTVAFLDFRAAFDISEPKDEVAEDVQIRLAFLDQGRGRAEAHSSGGSLQEGESGSVVECWDDDIDQQYISFTLDLEGEENDVYAEEGDLATGCGPIFQHTLDELQIPSLDTVDPAMLAAMTAVAEQGVAAMEDDGE